jgi:hypothetical protein
MPKREMQCNMYYINCSKVFFLVMTHFFVDVRDFGDGGIFIGNH